MYCNCLSRRGFITCSAAVATATLAGCDDPPAIVSSEEIEAMGLEAWTHMRSQVPLSEDRQLQSALSNVSGRMLRQIGESPGDWETQVFASSEINAFALPGRKIGVFEGMFRVTENTDQVAAIVVRAIEKKKPLVYAPGIWRWVMLVIKNLPRFVMRRIGF